MTPKQEEALRDYLQEVIVPLIKDVLVKKLGQALTFAKEELIQPKREWQGLTEDERDTILRSESSIFDMTEAILKAKNTPCPTCEALARTVMLDQTSHDTTPQHREPLTDEAVMYIVDVERAKVAFDIAKVGYKVARAIEAAHGITGKKP
jgi:hypothetical protein